MAHNAENLYLDLQEKNLLRLGLELLEPSSVATQRNCLQNSLQAQRKAEPRYVEKDTIGVLDSSEPEDSSALNLTVL